MGGRMVGANEVARLMIAVLKRVKQRTSLHLAGRIRTEFPLGAGMFPMFFGLAVRVEAWYRSPQWRFEASYGGGQWVSIVVEPSKYIHELRPDGKWLRRKSPIAVHPDEIKLRLFGLRLLDSVSFIALRKLSGMGRLPRTWWARAFRGRESRD